MTVYETSYLDPPWILSFDHVVLLSWWQFKRFFNKSGTSVVCKPLADVVVVHPAPRFTTAENRQKWEEACRWALLAYCDHGATSKDTFVDKVQLEGLPTEAQQELMDKFIFTAPDNRQQQRLTQCPPHTCEALRVWSAWSYAYILTIRLLLPCAISSLCSRKKRLGRRHCTPT